MTAYAIVNGTTSAITGLNAGGDSADARSIVTGITLTSTELVALCAVAGVAVFKDVPTTALKAGVVAAILYAYDTTNLDLSTSAKCEQFRLKRSKHQAEKISNFLGNG